MSDLLEARLQAHWAVQLASAPGTTLLDARDDFSHTNLSWSRPLQALVGQPVRGLSAALRLADLTLIVGQQQLSLPGRTYAEASTWLAEQFDDEVQRSTHEMPEHAIADGAAFGRPEGLAELAAHFDRADAALAELGHAVRCWPHHFDIAALQDLGEGRSVGTGLSPGDGSYPAPYYYVTPWPYPAAESLPPLAQGSWHTEGWIGAVLPGSEAPEAFLAEAVGASKVLLGA